MEPLAPRRSPLLRRAVVVPALLVAVAVAAVALYLFQPWKALTNTTVDEAVPSATSSPTEKTRDADGMDKPAADGSFVSHEHATSGTARTLGLADGGRVVRLEDLRTSEGPDVRVYLSHRSAADAERGLGAGAVELGKLKGNLGKQNYAVPAGTDPAAFRSVVIWCHRFSVSFGAADLPAAAAMAR
ncbi:electron transporter [Streptomyces albofaciens JCM 4342]|uniref:DM13 domain-containing protein n=1 Tax=Streptomyces albofaciens TaxID=66866 RepID=UPI00123A50FF|nr:DM13 domain-containing protein [Streptomyces albofaciens]KAA6222813.1 electron transporter [Streptomyces albofaciens JCM 4342]